uniref:Reverse transcriptase Ty1/copia-type domain-containing protein n=1 Tax=Cannabis sativa TaxID=3483 RepID=A0A803Q8I4_CANSA
MSTENKALIRNKTWDLVILPPNRIHIGCKWVYRIKYNADGSVSRLKERLVAKAPRAWFAKLSTILLEYGFQFSKLDPSLFIKANSTRCIYVLVYVDDILIMGSDDCLVDSLVTELNTRFALKDLGLVYYFLGIQVTRTAAGIHLTQTKYLQDLLTKAGMKNVNTQSTPMNSGLKLSNYGSEPALDTTLYRSIVGALQYATITRPELFYCVNKVCQYMQTPLLSHWTAVKRILRYIAGTLDYGLHIKLAHDFALDVFCDADQSTVLLATNLVLHARTKNIEIDLYFVRDKVLQQKIQVKHVPASAQLADFFTKLISSTKFNDFRSKLSVISLATLSLKGL